MSTSMIGIILGQYTGLVYDTGCWLKLLLLSKYSFDRIDSATDTIDQLSAKFRLNSQLSHNVHEQGI